MNSNGYSCCCGNGGCGGQPDLNRRDFIKTAAAAGAAAVFAVNKRVSAEELEAWNQTLLDQDERRVYRGDELTHIAMPLGGFGAGQVYLRGDGTLNPWQIVNNFNANANAPGSFFALRAKAANGVAATRVLQLDAAGEAMPVSGIEFSGEYPFAWVRYLEDELPVDIELEAFSPFIPLNTKDSGLPAVLFRFTMRNRTDKPVETSLLAAAPNLAGWDGYGAIEDLRHVDFGSNFNVVDSNPAATTLAMSSRIAGHRFERSARMYTNDTGIAYAMRHVGNLKVHYGERAPQPEDATPGDVLFVSDRHGSLSPSDLARLLDRVEKGACLVLTNDDQSLLASLGKKDRDDDIEVFEDWESGTYDGWMIEGDCFGDAPVTGTQPNQNTVTGWQGTYFVNTYNGTDGTQGTATSRTFTVQRRFIHLMVGGGSHRGQTCVNLVVNGAVVDSATGNNRELLRPVTWDVTNYIGKEAHIEIVDRHTGGWGHILVDRIVFSDTARADTMGKGLAKRFRNALPFRFMRSPNVAEPQPVRMEGPIVRGIESTPVTASGYLNFRFDWLKRDAEKWLETQDGTPLVVSRRCGEGTLVICNGTLDQWVEGSDRKAVLGNLAALATGNPFETIAGPMTDAVLYGSMALATIGDGGEVSACPQWDDFAALWPEFSASGRLADGSSTPSPPGRTWNGALAVSNVLQPGEEKTVTFALAWHFPNRTRDQNYGWGPPLYQYDHRLGNEYNHWFASATDVIDYLAANLPRLVEETHNFHTTFYNSTLPRYYLDCVTANASIMRSPIYVWLEDGTVGGFEGSDHCCPMNCTHVYNYAMSTAFFLPALERNVRETDLLVQMNPEEHYIPHRTVLPLSLPRLGFEIGGPRHPALDGELGTILKTYREYRQQGDKAWLASVWDRAKTLMRYIMSYHDPEGTGVIRGEQPNTYDTHLYGSNTFIGTLYLAALRAAEEMAKIMGDPDTAQEFRARFELGRDGYDKTCWNGEYYVNVYDAPDVDAAAYNDRNCYGPGCHTDQLLGQWWAFILDLGYVLPEERVRQALKATHHYCWRADLSDHEHNQRVFALGREKGLLTCTWPNGGRPERPILYCDEVWTGLEYHVAASLIHEGMVQEGLQIVRGARERYTGNQRNPWSEIECGGHYARAMSSYSLMTAAAGLTYDAGKGSLAFAPRITPDNFKGFFASGSGWGTVAQRRDGGRQRNSVDIRYGEVALSTFAVECPSELRGRNVRVTHKGEPLRATASFQGSACTIGLRDPIRLSPVGEFRIEIS